MPRSEFRLMGPDKHTFLHMELVQNDDKSAVVIFPPSHRGALWLARWLLALFDFMGKAGTHSPPTRPLGHGAAVGPSRGDWFWRRN